MDYIHGSRHVFVCRLGHVAIEAYGRPGYYRCKKIVRTAEDVDADGIVLEINWHPCRKKTLILEREFVENIYKRGYRKHRDRERMKVRRFLDNWKIELRDGGGLDAF